MPRKSVKGKTRSGSKVLAVRINRELANQFKAYCARNSIDKAEVIENLVFAPVSYTHLTLPTICSV